MGGDLYIYIYICIYIYNIYNIYMAVGQNGTLIDETKNQNLRSPGGFMLTHNHITTIHTH